MFDPQNDLDNFSSLYNQDIDQIAPYLFLGRLEAAENIDLLKVYGITHILTVKDECLKPEIQTKYTYKFKKLADDPESNLLEILEECIEFIDSVLVKKTGIIVHW
jgi:hypothetical protein